MTRVAWVESPLQLVNAIEHAQTSGDAWEILVRGGVPTLDDVAAALVPRLPKGTTLTRGVRSAFNRRVLSAGTLLVGDVHSGQVRAVLAARCVRRLVIVDDGAAMLPLADQIAAGIPLVRPANKENPLMQALGQVASTRVRDLMARGRVTVWTAYDATAALRSLEALGARMVPNTYEWTRTVADAFVGSLSGTVVVGSAMVADGLVRREAYREWLRGLAAEADVTYIPHRREPAEDVAAFGETPGVEICRPSLALELILAQQDEVERVVTLPSSVVATLTRILPEGVALDLVSVPEDWWTESAAEDFRAMVRQIEESRWNT